MQTRSQIVGTGLVLVAALLWGTTGTAQAFAPAGTPPLAIGAVRLAIGGGALLILAAGRGSLRKGTSWPPLATIFSSLSMAAYQPFFFAGVARTGVAVGTIVTIGSAPIIAGLFGYLLREERPRRPWYAATSLGILGCGLLVGASGGVSVDVGGLLLSLGAGAAYALFAVVSKGLVEDRPPDAVMAVVFCLAALALSPLLFSVDLAWLGQPAGLAVALHLGLIATALAYTLFGRGLGAVPVASAVTLSLAEPLTAGALGVFVLGEQLSTSAVLGMGLLFSGLALLAFQIKE